MMSDLRQSGIDPVIIGAALIQSSTTVAQGAADLAWPNGSPGKIGANVCLVAPSVSGKSLTLQTLNEPIHRYLANHDHDASSTGDPDFYLEDTTPAGIWSALMSWPIRALVAEEAGMLVSRIQGNSSQATLSKMLDGTPFAFSRGVGRPIALRNHRFSIFLTLQPDVFVDIKAVLGMANGSVGLPNRFFFFHGGWPVSYDQLHRVKLSDDTRLRFEARVAQCLDPAIRYGEISGKERPVLSLTTDAEKCLSATARQAAMGTFIGSQGIPPSEYCARSAERIRRLAAVFHVFENGPEGDVSEEYVLRAASVDNCSRCSFAQMTYSPPPVTPAMVLENALHTWAATTGMTRISLADIKGHRINLGLTSTQLSKALAELGGGRRIVVEKVGRTTWIQLPMFRTIY